MNQAPVNTYKVDISKKWDFENGYYLTCETSRIGKFLNYYNLYQQIINIPGDILEFGVYKGSSFIKFLSFRDILESSSSRRIIGFDIFGEFPRNLQFEHDLEFVKNFETAGGNGISEDDLDYLLKLKGFQNYKLVKGDIMETIPCYQQHSKYKKIALLHIDVDVYEPTKYILESFWDNVVKGGIVVLDDYNKVEGATLAIDEFVKEKKCIIRKNTSNYDPCYIIKE